MRARKLQAEGGVAKKTQTDGRPEERQGPHIGMSGTGCTPSGRKRAEDTLVVRRWKRRKSQLRRRAGVVLNAGRKTGKRGEAILRRVKS